VSQPTLPGFDEIRSTRSKLAEATRAHDLAHDLKNELLAMDEADGARAAKQAEYDVLVPVAKEQHHLEHHLEDLLKNQFDDLMANDDFVEIRAVLTPLYEARQELFGQLHPAYHQRYLIEAGVEFITSMLDIARQSTQFAQDNGWRPGDVAGALEVTAEMRSTIAEALDQFTIETLPPQMPPWQNAEDPKALLESLMAELNGYKADRVAEALVQSKQVDEMHARWDQINAHIEAVTG